MRTWGVKDRAYNTHGFEPSIGAGVFEYEFGALDGIDNKFAKSYMNLAYSSLRFWPS